MLASSDEDKDEGCSVCCFVSVHWMLVGSRVFSWTTNKDLSGSCQENKRDSFFGPGVV